MEMIYELEAALASVDAVIAQFAATTVDWDGASGDVMRSRWSNELAQMVDARTELSTARLLARDAWEAQCRDLGMALVGV